MKTVYSLDIKLNWYRYDADYRPTLALGGISVIVEAELVRGAAVRNDKADVLKSNLAGSTKSVRRLCLYSAACRAGEPAALRVRQSSSFG